MSIKQTGKTLRKIQDDSNLNARRIAENFPLTERTVNSFNKLHPHKTEFDLNKGKTAHLNLKIREFPILCTVNPPTLDIHCSVRFDGDNPGKFVASTLISTRNIPPVVGETPHDDFIWTPAGIKVPIDGCYSFLWTSPAWGASLVGDKHVSVGLLHNGFSYRVIVQKQTGFIATLGPPAAVYTPASPVYAVVECAAGDILSCFLTENNIEEGYPWVAGTVITGFFVDTGLFGAPCTIRLVAVAES